MTTCACTAPVHHGTPCPNERAYHRWGNGKVIVHLRCQRCEQTHMNGRRSRETS